MADMQCTFQLIQTTDIGVYGLLGPLSIVCARVTLIYMAGSIFLWAILSEYCGRQLGHYFS